MNIMVDWFIDRVLVLNLERRTDKKFFMLGSLLTRNVPPEMIEFHDGKDAADYSSAYEVRDAAIADGFVHFNAFKDAHIEEAVQLRTGVATRGGLACLWSFQRLIRDIAEGDQVTLMLAAEYFLPVDFKWLHDHIFEDVQDLRIFQIFRWEDQHYVEYNAAVKPSLPLYPVPWYPNPLQKNLRVSIGLSGAGDGSLVLSPAGARDILEMCVQYPSEYIENIIWRMAVGDQKEGYYSLNHFAFPSIGPYRTHIGEFSEEPDSDREHYI